MSSPITGEDSRCVPDGSERSPLIKHADSNAAYGSNSQSLQTDHNSSDFDGLGRQDEEALVDSAPHVGLPSQTSSAPLDTKTISWIILPMVLGAFPQILSTKTLVVAHR